MANGNDKRRVMAFISDLHIFSRYALMPPNYVTAEGITFQHGPGQRAIWDFYLEFCETCDIEGVDTVVVLGDVLHGQNPIEMGTMLVSPNMDEQVEVGKFVLGRIVNGKNGPRKLYMISGSGYHKGARGHNTEKDVCDQLGGTWLGPIANMKFPPSEKIFNLAHGESASFIYREMLLGREGMFLREAQAIGKIPKIDVFVRGHWHNFVYIHEKGMHMIQLPGWMAYEPSKPYLKSYGKMQGDIGGIILFTDNKDRIRVWHFLMDNIPHIADYVKEG